MTRIHVKTLGPPPKVTATVTSFPPCDFCGKTAKYDGKTNMGPWAFMCRNHYRDHGIGLGNGVGQELLLVNTRPVR